MDRIIVYPGAVPLSSDILWVERFTMYGLARMAETFLGTVTSVSGLACTPTSPASLNVDIAYGSIYQQVSADATPYGVLSADPNLLMKQGNINPITPGGTTAQVLSITPPGTPGTSINYLIEATYTDVDAVPVTLLYLNTSNPPASYVSPWSGPNNTGVAQNTNRDGVCTITLKAGTPAATGTQVTPTPDAGYVGLWVVTVAQGAVTVVSGNISQYPGAPFITPLTTTSVITAFREVLQIVAPYGSPPAATVNLGDVPMMQFSKANTPGVFFVFPVTIKMNLLLPIKVRFHYTNDLNGGNSAIQVAYQAFTTGAISPASYTSNMEALPAPATAGNMTSYLTTTAVIPSAALAGGVTSMIAVVISRQGPNGLDTNLGNLQIAQITLEQ